MSLGEALAMFSGIAGAIAIIWRVIMAIRSSGRREAEREAAESRAKDETRARMERMEPTLNAVLQETQAQSKDLAVIRHEVASLSGARQDHEARIRRMETKP